MHILHVTNAYAPVVNGVTASVAGWVEGLRDEGHDVVVWTVGDAESAGEGVVCTPALARLVDGYYAPATHAVPSQIAKHHWDVVHIHHPLLLGTAAAHFARDHQIPVISTMHSDYVAYADSYARAIAPLARSVVAAFVRRHFERADLVLAPSMTAANVMKTWGVSTPVRVCDYPVVAHGFKPLSRRQARFALGIAQNQPLALYAGRLAKEKRLGELIEEFEETVRWVPGAVLAIAGNGPLRPHVEEEASWRGPSVRYLGPLSRDELNLWYAAADVITTASRNEVGPLVVLEAAACKTAAVAREVSVFTERIRHRMTGLLCSTGRGDLGRAIALPLLDRSFAKALGVTAAEMNAHHSVDSSARLLGQFYDEVTGRRAPARATAPIVAVRRLQ